MKNYYLLSLVFFICCPYTQAMPTPLCVADTVKVGFAKDTIRVSEGESTSIGVSLTGVMPKDSAVEIKYVIKETDATAKKDFSFSGADSFMFRFSPSGTQTQSFELNTLKDNYEEGETITLELSIVKGGKITKLTSKQCLIVLQDFKTPAELAIEKYKQETQVALKRVQDIINADKDTSEIIGRICVKKFNVKKRILLNYTKDVAKTKGYIDDSLFKPEPVTVKIDSVEVLFKYGVAAEIKAYASDGEIYSNLWYNGPDKHKTQVGISFRHRMYKDRYRNFRLMGKLDPIAGIKMLDLLEYDPKIGLNYAPGEGLYVLNKDKPCKNITVQTSLNSYVHLNFYSDLLNLFGADPSNGLLQTEASAKLFLRTLPTKKKINFPLHYLSPYLKYSRFENGFRDVVATKVKSDVGTDSLNSIDRMLVNQRKFLDIGLKLNLFDHIGRFYNTTEFNVICNFGWFNVRGAKDELNTTRTGVQQYESIPHNTFDAGLELRHSIFQYRNFGINLAAIVFTQKIWNNKLKSFTNDGYQAFYRTEAELFYFPVADSKNKIFLRAYHLLNNNPKEANFMQLQFGYKLQFKLPNGKLR